MFDKKRRGNAFAESSPDFYKSILDHSPVAYAYHKIILDAYGAPANYEFIEVNPAFETMTGLKRSEIVGRKITEVLPDIRKDEFDWIKYYGEVALYGQKKEFEQYSESLKKWFRVSVHSPEKLYFITSFVDISSERRQLNDIKQLVKISEYFLQIKEKALDFRKISDFFLKLCDAKYVALNIFDENGRSFTTVAVSGDRETIKKVTGMLGFRPEGKKWEHDPVREEKTRNQIITRFPSLKELTGSVIPKPAIILIEQIFDLGEVVLVKIMRDETILGDFTLFMHRNKPFQKDGIAEIFSRQLGMAIVQKRSESALLEGEEKYRNLYETAGIGIAYYKPDGTVISFNNLAASNMGGVPADFCGKSIYDLFPKHEADVYMDRIRRSAASDTRLEFEDHLYLPSGEVWFLSTFTRVCDLEKNTVGVQIISQDITALKLVEAGAGPGRTKQ